MGLFGKLFSRSSTKADTSPFAKFAQNCTREVERLAGAPVTLEMGRTPDTTRLSWTHAGGWQVSQFLGNVWSEYQSGVPLDKVIERLMRSSPPDMDAKRDGEAARRSILPVIKTFGWHKTSLTQLANTGKDLSDPENQPFVLRLLAGDLIVAYVDDNDNSMSYVSNRDCKKLGLDLDELHALAMRNLERDGLSKLNIQGGGGRYAVRLDRNYDASMVLLFEKWCDRMDLDGEPVIAMPARDELLVCGRNDGETVAALRAMAADIASRAPYALSPTLFVWREGRLQTL